MPPFALLLLSICCSFSPNSFYHYEDPYLLFQPFLLPNIHTYHTVRRQALTGHTTRCTTMHNSPGRPLQSWLQPQLSTMLPTHLSGPPYSHTWCLGRSFTQDIQTHQRQGQKDIDFPLKPRVVTMDSLAQSRSLLPVFAIVLNLDSRYTTHATLFPVFLAQSIPFVTIPVTERYPETCSPPRSSTKPSYCSSDVRVHQCHSLWIQLRNVVSPCYFTFVYTEYTDSKNALEF